MDTSITIIVVNRSLTIRLDKRNKEGNKMILVRTTDGKKYNLPTNDEAEAIRLLGALGVPENRIFMLENMG